MMSTAIETIKFLLSCIPLYGMLLLIRKLNLKRLNRGRQFLMPILSLLFCIAVFVATMVLNHRVTLMVDNLQNNFVDFWINGPFADRIQTFATYFKQDPKTKEYLIKDWRIPEDTMVKIIAFIMKYILMFVNILVFLMYLVFKGIALLILNIVWGRNSALMSATTEAFYQYNDMYHFWFLREEMKDMKKLFRAFYRAAILIGVLLLALSRRFIDWGPMQSMIYPFFPALLLGECVFFLSGFTKVEYEEDIMGEDSVTQRVQNLSKLRTALKALFGDRLILESTEIESVARGGVVDLLEELAESDNLEDKITARYFEIVHAEGGKLDVDHIISARNLLKGENVLFCNPFYRDLTQYFMLPVSNTLMNRRKVLVIAGRKSTEPEIRAWLEEAVLDHLKMRSLWRIDSVGSDEEFEIGILPFSQLYNLEMLSEQREFFHEVGLVLIMEPSLILATGQVGLSLVVNYCDEDGTQPNYCMCDRNCDGLVDTLSHMIKQSITIVAATEQPTSLHSEMVWHSDGEYLNQRILPDISRYLGVGTELAVAAVKEQVPRVVWRGETKFPVVDMKWIAGQYYGPICQYAKIPVSQETVYSRIGFEADLWGTPKEQANCLIVEDEFCNMLEMIRLFLTRAEEQGFVNVISEDYLLRNYMQTNYRIFAADQKAIPTIVPDYARTERNATFRIMMMLMMSDDVSEALIEKELRLVGIQSGDLSATMNQLIWKYTLETRPVVWPVMYDNLTGLEMDVSSEKRLCIKDKKSFLERAGLSFQTAYYITEDDKEGTSFMDAKLFGHIYQANLPGQFFTYDGKYYEVRSVTAEKGVLVRRAADHIVGRRYYRQKRRYHLEAMDSESSRSRLVNGLEVTIGQYEISVETDGYLELDASNDLKTAREVRIGNDEEQGGENFDYLRNYRHKNVLRVRIPGASERVRYTLCLLLMEVFRTAYADGWHYLAAVTSQTEETRDALRGILYTVDKAFDRDHKEDDCIYIIEDSDVDMGLLESVDRNLTRLLGIITDYLDWHEEMLVTPDPPESVPGEGEVEMPPKPTLWERIKNFFKRIFHIKSNPEKEARKKAKQEERARKKAEKEAEREAKKAKKGKTPEGEVPAQDEPEQTPVTPDDPFAGMGSGDGSDWPPSPPMPDDPFAGMGSGDGSDWPTAPPVPDDPFAGMGSGDGSDWPPPSDGGNGKDDDDINHFSKNLYGGEMPEGEPQFPEDGCDEDRPVDIKGEDEVVVTVKSGNAYSNNCYLLYGGEEFDGALATKATLELLLELGFGKNELTQARKGITIAPQAAGTQTVETCDFCGTLLNGVAYDKLSDGRVRCITCSSTAISTVEQFRDLYKRVLPSMEAFFNIRISVPIRVRMVDTRKIQKGAGAVYKPTSGFDARVVGFAKSDRDGYSLFVENGVPRMSCIGTTVHELTHIWQYITWNRRKIIQVYGAGENCDMVYEGMAMWASIQFLYLIGENQYAQQLELNTMARDDVYGKGFLLYLQKYPLSRGTILPKNTPFSEDLPL